jgi:alpha-L-fucosidase
MSISRRNILRMLGAIVPGAAITPSWGSKALLSSLMPQEGPFKPTRESLARYEIPEWFGNAKFGIWAHWGPQSAPEYGDWYARNMYMQGSDQYNYQVKRYGHPSKFGFKDIIGTWKGEKFDPDYLLGLYKKAGARYFMSMGVHHDNFDMWRSTHHRWNAFEMGPRRDIVGEFRKAALKHGLRFGISDHLWISYKWFSTSHGSDGTGPLAGIPYDGVLPQYEDLYHDTPKVYTDLSWDDTGIPEAWKRTWHARIHDLIDQYHPDLLYCDGAIPFDRYGLDIVSHLYNTSAKHQGRTAAVYTSKRQQDAAVGTCVLDVERGVVDGIWPRPWQTDTCIGDWHYNVRAVYKTPKTIIDMLVDIVSRNGNLMLNFPLPSSGMLDDKELGILEKITSWMRVNSEGIYDTKPWKIYGFGPGTAVPAAGSSFNESKRAALGAQDFRFTRKGNQLYVFFMGWPDGKLKIDGLSEGGILDTGKIAHIGLLGHDGDLAWSATGGNLEITLPQHAPTDYACALRITRNGI